MEDSRTKQERLVGYVLQKMLDCLRGLCGKAKIRSLCCVQGVLRNRVWATPQSASRSADTSRPAHCTKNNGNFVALGN